LAIIARSEGARPSIAPRSAGSAGSPPSSRIVCPSPSVTVSAGPTGAAPCDTHGSSSTPWNRSPTAPPSTTSSPTNSAAPPSAVRALDSPPRIGMPGERALSSVSTGSVGNP
jgi:hypothetical protein